MELIQTIETTTINNKNYGIFIFVYIFGGIALFMLVGLSLHSVIIGVGGYITVMISPLFFEKQFRKRFIKKATVVFASDCLQIKQYRFSDNEPDDVAELPFNDIKSYKAWASSKNDFSSIKFILADGTKTKYTFVEQYGGKDDIVDILHKSIGIFNKSRAEGQKIRLIPNLFATKAGKYFIAVLTLLLITTIIVQIIYKPKTIPFSLLAGAMLYLQILAQRRKDLDAIKEQ
ncbi:hypothetical protein [Flavisolibacter ginsengisoli]|uniref:Uncharacterized protein n=1 Tax=Flavisolibacter ginsengisoli DSM 18119 TaxID=1121884 RepID=A0A1M4YDH7_9BACT|nr:hypothetical protein [Flavisolibacter ginsengisoli]SHF03817.1 hypothetical protein SAMN02745131_01685 [Flavisolibacter ginsengisoli DSM 18119]